MFPLQPLKSMATLKPTVGNVDDFLLFVCFFMPSLATTSDENLKQGGVIFRLHSSIANPG